MLDAPAKGSLQLAGSSKWRKVSAFAKSLAAVSAMLKKSSLLAPPPPSPAFGSSETSRSRSSHSSHDYLQTLRHGVKSAPVVRAFSSSAMVRNEAEAAQQALASGGVVTTVTDASELTKVEFWKQGDASLATEEKMAERQALRYDRKVRLLLLLGY